MMRIMNSTNIITVPWLVASLFLAWASQTAPPRPPVNNDPVLGGPVVPDQVARTLVQFDGRGQFVRLEGRPEEAAVALLGLDSERRERTRQATLPRRTALGLLLVDNIDLVKQITDAIRAGDADTARNMARELYDRFDPAHSRDPLLGPLAEILTPAEQTDLARLVGEYWKAWIDWELRSAADRSDEAHRQTEQRLTFELFQQEIRAAYEWTLRPYHDRLETIYRVADPTPEQRAAIRGIVIDYIRETRLEPTPEQRQQAAKRLYMALDEGARIKLFELLLSQL
jgi:hypothetical protein